MCHHNPAHSLETPAGGWLEGSRTVKHSMGVSPNPLMVSEGNPFTEEHLPPFSPPHSPLSHKVHSRILSSPRELSLFCHRSRGGRVGGGVCFCVCTLETLIKVIPNLDTIRRTLWTEFFYCGTYKTIFLTDFIFYFNTITVL